MANDCPRCGDGDALDPEVNELCGPCEEQLARKLAIAEDGLCGAAGAEYAAEVRGFNDMDPPEPPDPYDLDDFREID